MLEESIVEGLRYVLGESGLQVVLRQRPLQVLASDPTEFHEALTSIFKEAGAAIIEKEIARRLLDKAGTKEDQLHRSWLSTVIIRAGAARRVSQAEKKALRQYVALADLPRAHGAEVSASRHGMGMAKSIELTSLAFADAFKKGS